MELATMVRDEKLDAIIIDSFHAAASHHSGQSADLLSEYDLFFAWSSSLSMIGVETGVAILTIAHRNRSSNTKSGDAGLHSAKGTGSLEYLAETVIDISSTRDEVLSKKREHAIKVNVEKNPQGATGSVDIRFDTWRQTFSE
jgi:replicative DNA helicase